MWTTLSGERTGLSFTIAAGARQVSHSRVRVPWDSRTYFTVSDSRLPFSSPSTTRRATVSTREELFPSLSCLQYLGTDRTENTFPLLPCYCCLRVCWGSHFYCIPLLPWKDTCLQSRYMATAVLYMIIPRSLAINGSTCHNIKRSIFSLAFRNYSAFS
jgi:hypothetical protein